MQAMTIQITISPYVTKFLYVAGPIFFLLMQGSALLTAYKIHTNKSVGHLSSIPFLSLISNCSIWTMYAALIHDKTVFFPNFTGIFVGYVCAVTYHIYSTNGIPKLYLFVVGLLLLISILLGYFSYYKYLGLIGMSLSIILMGSPLATLKNILETQTTESLPFLYSLMTWFNSLSWSLYGLIDSKDANVYIPNLIGFSLASFQLFLFVLFGFPENKKYDDIESALKLNELSNLK